LNQSADVYLILKEFFDSPGIPSTSIYGVLTAFSILSFFVIPRRCNAYFVQSGERVVQIPTADLYSPEFHPFIVQDDEALSRLAESVKEYGVREPGLTRLRNEGGYELICGNRRKRACELADVATMPVIIRNLGDATCELTYPLTIAPYVFVGKKPAAVLFGSERVEAKSWREVYAVIIKRCNESTEHHEMLMYLRNKTAGKRRVFLSDRPDGMTRPLRIEADMYGETHYGSQTLMHILLNRILTPAYFDCSNIRVVTKN